MVKYSALLLTFFIHIGCVSSVRPEGLVAHNKKNDGVLHAGGHEVSAAALMVHATQQHNVLDEAYEADGKSSRGSVLQNFAVFGMICFNLPGIASLHIGGHSITTNPNVGGIAQRSALTLASSSGIPWLENAAVLAEAKSAAENIKQKQNDMDWGAALTSAITGVANAGAALYQDDPWQHVIGSSLNLNSIDGQVRSLIANSHDLYQLAAQTHQEWPQLPDNVDQSAAMVIAFAQFAVTVLTSDEAKSFFENMHSETQQLQSETAEAAPHLPNFQWCSGDCE